MALDTDVFVWNLFLAGLAVGAMGQWAFWLTKGQSPLFRHRLLSLAVLLLAACPVAILACTFFRFGALSLARAYETRSNHLESRAAPITGGSGADADGVASPLVGAAKAESAAASASMNAYSPFRRFTRALAFIWLAGGGLVFFRWLRGFTFCSKLKNNASPVEDPRLLELARKGCNAAQLDVTLPVYTSWWAPSPMVMGVWEPRILLPKRAADCLSDEELLCVFTHEAAHVARHDIIMAIVQRWATGLFWWNPLVHAMNGNLDRLREHACDDYVLRARGAGELYAEALVKLAEWCVSGPAVRRPVVMYLQGGNDLEERVIRLLEGGIGMRRRLGWAKVATLLGLGTCMVGFAFVPLFRVQAQERSLAGGAPIQARPTAEEKKSNPNLLTFNDGSAEGKRSIAGAAEFVSFSLPADKGKVAGIRIHGSRYGTKQPPNENFMIYFLDKELSETIATKMAPYSRFERGEEKWVEVKFPKPVDVPKDFWVGTDFRAAQTKGIYLSFDTSTDGSRSRVGLPGQEIRPANLGGDWMMEVILAK